MKRRTILAAVAVIVGGTLAAAAPARAATPFSCIGAGPVASNIASGVEFNVAFTGDFPDVVVGEPFAIQPTVQYKLDNAYLRQLVGAGVLTAADDGDRPHTGSAASPSGSRSPAPTRWSSAS